MIRTECCKRMKTPCDKQQNILRAVVSYTFRTTAALCASGTLMQTFLKTVGFSSHQIYIHSTVIQAFTVISILLGATWADKGSVIRRSAFICVPNALLFLCYLPICIGTSAGVEAYLLLLGVSALQAVTTGLNTVCEYKLPYYLYDSGDYGRVLGICGVISATVNFAVGAVVSWLVGFLAYREVMFAAFLLSFFFMLGASLMNGMQKPVCVSEDESSGKERRKDTTLAALRHPAFTLLIAPNFIRGLCAGIVGVLATVALDIGYDERTTTVLVSVQGIATFIGCSLFTALSKKVPYVRLIFLAGLCFLPLPLLLSMKTVVLLIVYFIVTVGRNVVDNAVPAMLRDVVPVGIAGPYHAMRMVLNNGGMMLATLIAPLLPVPVLLTLTGILQVAAGGVYLWFMRRQRGQK